MKDLIIIGCGPGGYDTASYAASKGFSVTIFEKAEPGGTCLNRGCIPTKVYCHVASVLLEEQKLQALGIVRPTLSVAGEPPGDGGGGASRLSFPAVKAHKDAVVDRLRQGVETLMAAPGITLVRGEAKVRDAQTVACGGKDYTADNIIIATGSHSAMPPIEGTDSQGVVSSTGLLAMDTLPRRLAIIGAGVIGMEMASAFNAFGSEVTVIEFLKECLPPMDQDLAKRLRKLLEKRGVRFCLGASAKEIRNGDTPSLQNERQSGEPLTVVFTQKGKETTVEADTVLIATGRRPNTDGLGLDDAGIAYDRHGITVDGNYETSLKGVFAIGDVNGKVMLAHAARQQGRHVIDFLSQRSMPNTPRSTPLIPSAVFTIPELAGVGPTEGETVHKSFYRANGKAVAMDATDGLVKVITDADGRITACHTLGAHAADIVQEATALIELGATYGQLQRIVHIHPTLGELLVQ